MNTRSGVSAKMPAVDPNEYPGLHGFCGQPGTSSYGPNSPPPPFSGVCANFSGVCAKLPSAKITAIVAVAPSKRCFILVLPFVKAARPFGHEGSDDLYLGYQRCL